MNARRLHTLFAALLLASTLCAQQPAPLTPATLTPATLNPATLNPATLNIDTQKIINPVSPTLYGLMTEEINHAFDGGLYAELIRNRSFTKIWSGYEGWRLDLAGSANASFAASTEGPTSALNNSIALTITAASPHNEAGLANTGWWGIALHPSTTYTASFFAKSSTATTAHLRLVADSTGTTLAEARIPLTPGAWQSYKTTLHTRANITPSAANHFVIAFDTPGTILLQLVSLFPPTYANTPNGNRPDLMQMMAAMRPHFLRLPGGNYLEGDTVHDRFNWRETIGPLATRPTHLGPWRYQSTDGMGLLEMLRWCEDLHIEPVLAVYAGYSLKGEHVTGPALAPFVQDALDEIEYVTGDATATHWGALRARDGHPAPFALRYIEIGNEDQFDKAHTYPERFAAFASAIRAKYPALQLIATTPTPRGNPDVRPDVIDDHFYKTAEDMFALVHHYDAEPRNGPKIFVGEWATRTGTAMPDFAAALGDAAWMTSLERNSDLIVMSAYAPLLTNLNPNASQWDTDLIGYDALHAFGSPSYWAQVLFAAHLGTHTVASTLSSQPEATRRFFSSSTLSADGHTLFLKLVNASDRPQTLILEIPTASPGRRTEAHTLHAADTFATNSLAHPNAIIPTHSTLTTHREHWPLTLPPFTIEVLDIPIR